MRLTAGHRFAVTMAETFPFGCYAMGVQQSEDFDEKTGRRSPSRDKNTGEPVWTVLVIDRDPEARDKQFKVKVSSPYCPVLPGEVAPGSGLHPVEFVGMTATPYVTEAAGMRRARLAISLRATDMVAQGKAPTGSSTSTGRSSGQASTAPAPTAGGDGKAA